MNDTSRWGSLDKTSVRNTGRDYLGVTSKWPVATVETDANLPPCADLNSSLNNSCRMLESKFVESMRGIYESVGALKEAKAVAYQETIDSNTGKQHILIFDLAFEHDRGRERLVFTRTNRGEMRLWDIVIEPLDWDTTL